MDKNIAEILINNLKTHCKIENLNYDSFLEILINTNISKSSKYYKKLSTNKQILEEYNTFFDFSLRRILKNKKINNYNISKFRKSYDKFISLTFSYSSDILIDKIRENSKLVDLMENSKSPYSLLAKLKKYEFDDSNKNLHIITKPLLIIPDVENKEPIYNWEKENTIYT